MVRSANGSTEYKVVARLLRPMASSPRISRAALQAASLLMLVKGEAPTVGNPQCLEQRRMTFVRRGDNYDGSDCAFAVKPRAFGAPLLGIGA